MLWVAALLTLGLLTWIFSGALERQHNPNRDIQGQSLGSATEITLDQNRAGHYVATGTINDSEVTMMLDTGATDVAIPPDLARELNLPELARVRMRTANGVVEGYRTRLDRVALGPIELNDVSAAVVPNLAGDVLLGMSFLKRLDWQQQDGQLILRQEA